MQRAQGATVAKMDEQTTRTARYLDIQALESRMEALLAMEPTEEVARNITCWLLIFRITVTLIMGGNLDATETKKKLGYAF